MEEVSIAVLLTTYNGQRYLSDLMESLLRQSYQGFDIYIHDDGSTDGTPGIIRSYSERHANIHVLDYPGGLGAKDNFFSLFERVDADYYMFCDEDDVWLPDKVEKTYRRMREEEDLHPGRPLMVSCDAQVVDDRLRVIHPSFIRYSGFHPEFLTSFAECGATTYAPGCTMMVNRRARQCMVRPTAHTLMHDAWIHLCVLKAGGVTSYVDEPLMLYRQHAGNTIGARDARQLTVGYRLRHCWMMARSNYRHYMMLHDLGYGSVFKYVKYKRIYRQKINNATNGRQ